MSNHQKVIKNKVGLWQLSEMPGSSAIPSVISNQRLRIPHKKSPFDSWQFFQLRRSLLLI